MRGSVLLFLIISLSGCILSKKSTTKDWLSIYQKEMLIAKENDDQEAFLFFWQEYQKEKSTKN